MLVRLEPLKAGHSEDQHASFTVLVAEEVTESKNSPFYNAIMPLFKRWRDNLREQFRKTFGQNKSSEPDYKRFQVSGVRCRHSTQRYFRFSDSDT